jgi:hypothetical protein
MYKVSKPHRSPDGDPAGTPTHPPLRFDSTIELAWGLTLNLSHEKNEVKIGQAFLDYYKMMKERFKSNNHVSGYLENLDGLMSTYLRSMGFERDVFVKGLDIIDKVRDERIKGINDLADMTSFSKDGLILRVSSFLGIGTLANFLASPGFLPSSVNLNLLLFWGFLGLIAGVGVAKLLRGSLITWVTAKAYTQEQFFWKEHGKKVFTSRLRNFSHDLKALGDVFYPKYHEPVLDDDKILSKFLDEILPDEKVYESRIGESPRWLRYLLGQTISSGKHKSTPSVSFG